MHRRHPSLALLCVVWPPHITCAPHGATPRQVLIGVSVIFVKLAIPETKGKTLEEIEAMLEARNFSPYQRLTRRGGSVYESVSLLDDDDGDAPAPQAI